MPKNGSKVPCDYCGKMVYRTQYRLAHSKHQFCNSECERAFRYQESHETRKCVYCGKEFTVTKLSTQKLCSVECQHKWQTTQVGPLNARFTSVPVICERCGTQFYRKQCLANNDAHKFCSEKCRQGWYSDTWSQSPEWRQKSRKRAVKLLKSNPTITYTKPQQLVNQLLDALQIDFRTEEPFQYYSIDNYLPQFDLAIEVMGDYWHMNPTRFHMIKSKDRLDGIRRDKAKQSYMWRYHQIHVLYLWEDDILHRSDLCKKLIEQYTASGGELDNYHSFNYELLDERCSLKDNLIVPYQEYSRNALKAITQIAV